MQAEPHDWTVPAPLRALLWWPPVAFIVALLDPTAAAGTIATAGAVLAVLGVLGATVGSVIARRLAGQRGGRDEPALPPLAMAGAESASPLPVEQQAA
jgi:hypothetical protein